MDDNIKFQIVNFMEKSIQITKKALVLVYITFNRLSKDSR